MGSSLQLAKPRISLMIALTAMVGYLATVERGAVEPLQLLTLALVMVLGSAAASIFNHFYDRDIDRLMPRTSTRPFAARHVKYPSLVLGVAAFSMFAGVCLAVWFLNPAVALHLFLGSFVYAVIYTVWLKRRTWMNIVIGGMAGSFALLAGAATVEPDRWLLPMLLAVFLFFWTPTHFWALAIRLKDQYRDAGVPMLPVVVGSEQTARWLFINSLFLVASSMSPWVFGELGAVYGTLSGLLGVYILRCNARLVKSQSAGEAMANFFASMKYLGGIFLAVVLDVHMPV